ncbi:MAG: hypothetical protein M4579_001607 [Chaenotheca gracillima]|nr:MAG: hypothetical protein M4579_001607 [Chaenotheca gracillima]
MSSTREGPNPLRPYYVPQSPNIGFDQHASNTTSSAAGVSGARSVPSGSSKPSFSSARNVLSDFDYSDYLSDSGPSATEVIKSFLDQALWKYTSVLLAQPFEVAKTVLQCHIAVASEEAKAGSDRRRKRYDAGSRGRSTYRADEDSVSDEEDTPAAYFTSSAPQSFPRNSRSDAYSRTSRHTASSHSSPSPSDASDSPPSSKLRLRYPPSILDVISQLWQKEGAWGVWKGANTTFIYSVFFKTIETWTRGFLAALANIPDPGMLPNIGVSGLDIADSPYPWLSLGVIVSAAGFAGILLAPLDLVRTRLILTPTARSPRSPFPLLRLLPSLSCPPALFTPTLLHSTIPPLFTTTIPLFLRSRLGVDPILSPNAYSVFRFASATCELFIRLPLETVLRRAQAHIGSAELDAAARTSKLGMASRSAKEDLIVDVGAYKSPFGTMWYISREEGSRSSGAIVKPGVLPTHGAGKTRKGQGFEGLCRGWRVGMWGLGGMWVAAMLGGAGGAGKGGEF